jgi:predicted phosphodiesterase
MKVQIFSDLHVDVPPIKKVAIADDVDLVIVAGDTCEGAARQSGWKWSVNLDEKRPVGL